MKTILIFIQSETQFNELKRLPFILNKEIYQILFCFDMSNAATQQKLQQFCQEQHWLCVTLKSTLPCALIENGVSTYASNSISPLNKMIRNYLPRILSKASPYLQRTASELKSFWTIRDIHKANFELLILLFNKYKVDLIVLGEDGMGMNSSLTKAARHKKIPMIVFPYEFSTTKQIVESIIRFKDYETDFGALHFWNRLALYLYPNKWSRNIQGKPILRTSGYHIMAQELSGCSPKLPWTVHGGYANYLAAESPSMVQHYRNEHIDSSKIVLTGSLAFDTLHEQLKKDPKLEMAYLNTQAISSGELCILSAFPGDYTKERKELCEFNDYYEVLDYWISQLQIFTQAKLLFQAHPALSQEYRDYLQNRNITLLSDDIATLIPQCDVLITSVSSIIRMAIVCKKPVINYDIYHFNYPDYLSVPGVIHVQDKMQFAAATNKIVSDPLNYEYYAHQQALKGEEWGLLDGQVQTRIRDLINRCLEEKA